MRKLLHIILLFVIVGMPYCFCDTVQGAELENVSESHTCCESEQAADPVDPCAHCTGMEQLDPFTTPSRISFESDDSTFSMAVYVQLQSVIYPPSTRQCSHSGLFIKKGPHISLFKQHSVYRL